MGEGLTKRERQVLILAARGKSNKEIGRELRVATKTVEYHLTNAQRKLMAANRACAVVKAVQQGLISLEEISNED